MATVEAEVKNNIAPSSPVRIDKIFVEVGDHVSKFFYIFRDGFQFHLKIEGNYHNELPRFDHFPLHL